MIVKGSVQGVGYRWFVRRTAGRMNISGWVRNLDNGDVEAEACGAEEEVKAFIENLRNDHPYARVNDIEISGPEEIECPGSGFEIVD